MKTRQPVDLPQRRSPAKPTASAMDVVSGGKNGAVLRRRCACDHSRQNPPVRCLKLSVADAETVVEPQAVAPCFSPRRRSDTPEAFGAAVFLLARLAWRIMSQAPIAAMDKMRAGGAQRRRADTASS